MTTRVPLLHRRPARHRLGAAAAVFVLPFTLVACGGDSAGGSTGSGDNPIVGGAGEGGVVGGGGGDAPSGQAVYDKLMQSTSTSVRLSVEDPDGAIKRGILADDPETPEAIIDTFLGGSISFTVDPAGDQTLGELQATSVDAPVAEQLKATNVSFSVDAKGGPIAQLRLVDGVMYAAADLNTIGDIAVEAGEPNAQAQLDAGLSSIPQGTQLATDLRDGKFLKLDLAPFAGQLEGLTGAAPMPDQMVDGQKLAQDLLAAVQPFTMVTGGENGTYDVEVEAKRALTALADSLKASGIPGFDTLDATELDMLKEGTVKGSFSTDGDSLTEVTLDLQSLIAVVPDDGGTPAPDLSGSILKLEIDDSADEVGVPDGVSDIDLNALVSQLFGSFLGGASSVPS